MLNDIDHLIQVLDSRRLIGLDELQRPDFVPSSAKTLNDIITDLRNASFIPNPPATVLDLGCGNGIPACVFAAYGYEAYGIDLDAFLIQEARKTSGICARLFPTFDTPRFAVGNYLPPDLRQRVIPDRHVLLTDTEDPCLELDLEPEDVDIFYCYAWPGQVDSIHDLFNTCAKKDARLLLVAMPDLLLKHDPSKTRRAIPRFVPAGIEPETQTIIHEHYTVFERI